MGKAGGIGLICTLFAAACLARPVSGAVVDLMVNGTFEDTTGWGDLGSSAYPFGWAPANGTNGIAKQAGIAAIGGSGTSAYLPMQSGLARHMRHSFVRPSEPRWWFDMDFASEDPGGLDDRSLNLYWTYSGGQIQMRLVDVGNDGDGDLQVYNTAWHTILSDAVLFGSDVTTGPLLVHHLSIRADFRSASPTYDVILTDANHVEHAVFGVSVFRDTRPVGRGLTSFQVNPGLSKGDWLIDNVSLLNIPEPTTGTIALLGLVTLAFWRRKGRRKELL